MDGSGSGSKVTCPWFHLPMPTAVEVGRTRAGRRFRNSEVLGRFASPMAGDTNSCCPAVGPAVRVWRLMTERHRKTQVQQL